MSLLLVNGGRSSSIGRCSLLPVFASGQSTRLMKARTALSDTSRGAAWGRAGEGPLLSDEGVERRGGVLLRALATVEESLNVGTAFGRGCKYGGGRGTACVIAGHGWQIQLQPHGFQVGRTH